MECGFQATVGWSAGGPDQPEDGVEKPGANADFGREGAGFGDGAKQVSPSKAQEGAAEDRQ